MNDSIKDYEKLNMKDFNISIIEYLCLPYDIRNQLVETVRSTAHEKAQAMNELVNNPANTKPFG